MNNLKLRIKFPIFKFIVFIIAIFSVYIFPTKLVKADLPDCSKPSSFTSVYDQQYCDIQKIKDQYAPAQESNKKDLANLQKQLADLTKKISSMELQIKEYEKDIEDREEDLAYTQEIFEEKTRSHYTFLRLYDPITPFLFSYSASEAFQEISLRQKVADEDRKALEQYSKDLSRLKNDNETLQKSKSDLASIKKQVNEKATFLQEEVGKVDTYLSTLSAQQESILAAKSGSFMISVGDVELADDYNASIKGFRESAPTGSFAIFSLGGYTHRKGMSQYGAKGRAMRGKNYDEILRAYYSFDNYEDRSGITIRVNNGNGVNKGSVIWSGSLEDYVKRIYEVPSSWPTASLEAQVIAARTYALAVTGNGAGTICATQDCQVFKTSPKGGNWESAVNSTSGKVMVSGGGAIKAYFSSTTGGFSFDKGWDTDGGGSGDLLNKAYEAIGGSPWLYKAWYRQGTSSSGGTCGQNDPWLNNEEFTDIINAVLVLRNGSDNRVVPITTCAGGGGGYSYSELRSKGGINNVTSVIVTQGNGETTSVLVNGNINITGNEFKKAFNLRAPGYLRIPQGLGFGSSRDFAFFNIEKK